MSCYHPLRAFRAGVNDNGRMRLVWKQSGTAGVEVFLPCGQCVGCRLERSRQWAMRCVHEASMNDDNCFITLTYNDEYLPKDMSLDVREFQLFMKRLRKEFGAGIRFYHCGEYGENFGRPHYHAILFGFDFADKVFLMKRGEHILYESPSLTRLWGKGFASIGAVTFESAAYVARYVMKKVTGDAAEAHYQGRKPEYTTMSRGSKKLRTGGIGKGWIEKFKSDVYPSDECIVRGKSVKPPRYYDNWLEASKSFSDKFLHLRMKAARKAAGRRLERVMVDNEWRLLPRHDSLRLAVKEQVKLASISSLKREIK